MNTMGIDKKNEGGSHESRSICTAQGCKAGDFKLGFCPEHYEQYKFGIITKTGKPVPDYEKKFGHYTAYKERKAARKVA